MLFLRGYEETHSPYAWKQKSRDQCRLHACSCVLNLTSDCIVAKWHHTASDFIHCIQCSQALPSVSRYGLLQLKWCDNLPGNRFRNFSTFPLKSWQCLAFKECIISTFKAADSIFSKIAMSQNDAVACSDFFNTLCSVGIIAYTANTHINGASRVHIFAFYLFSFAISL